MLNEEVPRYKKKSEKQALPKAKHKHEYRPCLYTRVHYPLRFEDGHGFVYGDSPLQFGLYCTICGRFKNSMGKACFTDDEAERELNPETRTIPLFSSIKYEQKFIELPEQEGVLSNA